MLISGKGRSTGSGKLGELPPKLGMGTENSSLDESKPMVLMLGDFYLFQFHSDFKCKNSSRVCYKERQKKSCHVLSPHLFLGSTTSSHPPKLLRWHFQGTAGTCHEMVSLQCQTRGLSPCQPPGVFNPPSSLFGFREGNTGKTSDHGG